MMITPSKIHDGIIFYVASSRIHDEFVLYVTSPKIHDEILFCFIFILINN